MNNVHVAELLECTDGLTTLFLKIAHILRANKMSAEDGKKCQEQLDDKDVELIGVCARRIERHSNRMGFTHSQHHCQYVLDAIKGDPINLEMLFQHLYALRTDLYLDLNNRCFLYLEPNEAMLYQLDIGEELGRKLWEGYPDVRYDIKESIKCMALCRFTAAVYHTIRPLELGIRAIWRSLYCPGTNGVLKSGWGEYVRQLDDFMKRKGNKLPPRPADWSEREAFYQKVQGHIDTITRAWRHRTMHMESRYDQDEAVVIINSCNDFFRQIAECIDQDGNYTAP